MSEDKFVQRSAVLEILSKLKSTENISEGNIQKAINAISAIPDKTISVATLLKEINFKNPRYDVALALIAKTISPTCTIEQIYKLLENKRVSDKKKIFLINLLRDLGEKVSLNDYEKYLSSPQDMLDIQTELFIKISEVNPEAQIDFLDFFFAISPDDKINLLNSIKDDFKGEELANAIEPILEYDINAEYIPLCVEILKSTKTYIAKVAIQNLIDLNSRWSKEAKIAIKELTLAGLRENITKADILKKKLNHTMPLGFWSCLVDGLHNFTIIFARQKADKTIATFFTVINLKSGIKSSFGFDDITIDEFKKILNRFFKTSYIISLDDKVASKIIKDNIDLSRKTKSYLPYEFICWKNYIEDIEIDIDDLDSVLEKGLNKVDVNDSNFGLLFDKDILTSWFYTVDDSDLFRDFISKIEKLNKPKISHIDSLISEFCNNSFDEELLSKKLLYQAYLTLNLDLFELADTLYSIISDDKYRKKLKERILKMSIYQHFLALSQSNKNENVFRMNKTESNVIDCNYFIELFEEKWNL